MQFNFWSGSKYLDQSKNILGQGISLIGCKIRENWGFVFRFLLKPSPDVVNSSKWKIFNGNEIGTLLAWWQLQVHYKKFGDQYQRKVKLITSSHDSWIYESTNFVFTKFSSFCFFYKVEIFYWDQKCRYDNLFMTSKNEFSNPRI